MTERKKNNSSNSSKITYGPKLLPSLEGSENQRNWYLDRKSYKERNKILPELFAQWEDCFLVGKFKYSLISDLRYWDYTPDRKTIELAISDKYRDKKKLETNYDSELNRVCFPAHIPLC